jgi:hypothetical protein
MNDHAKLKTLVAGSRNHILNVVDYVLKRVRL